MKRLGVLVIAALLGASPGFAQTSKERIDEGVAAYENTFNAGDTATVASFYTEDAVLLPGDGQRIEGKQAIETYHENDAAAGVKDLTVASLEWFESGDVAFDVGDFALTQADGTRLVGRYLVVLQRDDQDTWRFHRVIWNGVSQ